MTPRVSVVIPTNGRAAALRRALSGLVHLDHDDFEVIVVVGPDGDGIDEVRASAPDEVCWLTCPDRNVSMSRNIGIAAAAGRLVAFLDDDAVPEAAWLDELEAAFADPEVAAAGGPLLDHTGGRWQSYFSAVTRSGVATSYTREWLPGGSLSSPESWTVPYAVGANSCFRRAALVEADGYDEHFAYCYDDADICLRLCDLGHRVATLQRAVVHHGFMPNAVRGETRVLNDWSGLFSALFYFASRHGHLAGSVARTWEDVGGVVGRARDWHTRLAAAGVVDADAVARFEEALERESEAAHRAALAADAAGVSGALGRHPDTRGTARRFPSWGARLGGGHRVQVCLVADGGDAERAAAGERARAMVDGLGAIVRVVSVAGDDLTVTFDDGVWWHDVPADGDAARAVAAELGRIGAIRPVDAWDGTRPDGLARTIATGVDVPARLPAPGGVPDAEAAGHR